MRKRLGATVNSSVFAGLISWDPAHLLILASTDLRLGKIGFSSQFLQRLSSRCSVFSRELGYGKGNFAYKATIQQSNKDGQIPRTFCSTRSLSSSFPIWSNLVNSYSALVKAYHTMNPLRATDDDEEFKYKIQGKNFVYDILVVIDILGPLVEVVTALQSLNVPI